jgi:predicted dehydrogenase
MSETRLRIGVAGAGHFGRFHALKLAASPRASLSGIADLDSERAAAVAREAGTMAMPFEALLMESDAVVIAAPAAAHFALADAALRAGRHVLVEKPIAATLEEADTLAALAAQTGLVLQVGHLLRYAPEHAAIQERMKRPLYIESVRIAPFKRRGTDVSVILDLMIHDLDLLLSLVGSELERVDAVGAPVASGLDDIANARLYFANGCVATVTASRVSLRTERRMRLFGEHAYMAVDFTARSLTMIGRDNGVPIPGIDGARMETTTWPEHDAIAAEHEAFMAAILDGAPVLVDAATGRRALAAALAVTEAMAEARAKARRSGLLS